MNPPANYGLFHYTSELRFSEIMTFYDTRNGALSHSICF